jgi:hypothetical protein
MTLPNAPVVVDVTILDGGIPYKQTNASTYPENLDCSLKLCYPQTYYSMIHFDKRSSHNTFERTVKCDKKFKNRLVKAPYSHSLAHMFYSTSTSGF